MTRANTTAAGVSAIGIAATSVAYAALPDYWIFLLTAGVVTAIALQSVGIVSGRCGMTALCQMSFAGVGAWTVAWLNVHHAPGTLALWILVGGVVAAPVGALVGALSLRLRGANLAIATLGAATLFDAAFVAAPFPGQLALDSVSRPAALNGDREFFVFTVVVFTALALLIGATLRTRIGLSWLMIRHSERATAALGHSVATAKLSAFALSAFVAGVAGGLVAGQLGTVAPASFGLMTSLTLFTAGTMVGARRVGGAMIGGVVAACLPELLRRVGLPQDIGPLVFAGGALAALRPRADQPEHVADDASTDSLNGVPARRAHEPSSRSTSPAPPRRPGTAQIPALELVHLSAAINSLVVFDHVSITFAAGTVTGLIGANGSGKSTLIDAVSGFRHYVGQCRLDGQLIDAWSARRRGQAGIRRTWQHPRIARDLSIAEFLSLSTRGHLSSTDIAQCRAWLDDTAIDVRVATLTVGQQRRLEVIGAVMARPRVLLLDEPTVGQSRDSARRIHDLIQWSAQLGAAVILVEHNRESVRQVCDSVIVLSDGHATVRSPEWTTAPDRFSRDVYSPEHVCPTPT